MTLAGPASQPSAGPAPQPKMLTRRRSVIFRNAFLLPCFSGPLPAGTYEISTIDEETAEPGGPGWRRLSTLICTPSLELKTGAVQWTSTSIFDLEAALKRDAQTLRPRHR